MGISFPYIDGNNESIHLVELFQELNDISYKYMLTTIIIIISSGQ